MALYYPCNKCNKKYKRLDKILHHLKINHNIYTEEVPEQIKIEKNKISYEDKIKMKEEKERKRREEKILKEKKEKEIINKLNREKDIINKEKDRINKEKEILNKEKDRINKEKEILKLSFKQINSNVLENNINDYNECKICLNEISNIAFIPCGHTISCNKCSEIIIKSTKKCPLCRSHINNTLKIFNS
jgi:hypothetical protein